MPKAKTPQDPKQVAFVLERICNGEAQADIDKLMDRKGRSSYIFERVCKSEIKGDMPKTTIGKLDKLRMVGTITDKLFPPRPNKPEGGGNRYKYKKSWELSPIERRVVAALSNRKSMGEAAEILGISASSATSAASKAYGKMGTDNAISAVKILRKFSLKR